MSQKKTANIVKKTATNLIKNASISLDESNFTAINIHYMGSGKKVFVVRRLDIRQTDTKTTKNKSKSFVKWLCDYGTSFAHDVYIYYCTLSAEDNGTEHKN